MKINTLFLAAALTAAAMVTAFSMPTQAAEVGALKISSGLKGGSYYTFMAQAGEACRDALPMAIDEAPGGSEMNLDRLLDNSYSVAPMQADYLAFAAMSNPDVNSIKVLLPLFPEQLHFIALRTSIRKTEGKFMGLGATAIQINSVGDLKPGTIVAASGGAKTTALLFQRQTGLGYAIDQSAATPLDALGKLKAGQVDAVLLVGASPLDFLATATPENKALLKLLPVPDSVLGQLKNYSATKVGYTGIGDGSSVPTAQVQSVLATQDYSKRQTLSKAVHELKKCLLDVAPDMAGTPGKHKAWRGIKEGADSKWPQWADPWETAEATPVTVKAKAKK